MRKLLLLGFSIISLQIASSAQNIDLFGGYSYLRGSGWEASATGNFTRHFGLKTDFSGNYGDFGRQAHTFLGGPQIKANLGKGEIFAHALFGYQRLSYPEHSFAMAFGGGYDWTLSPRVSLRLLQFDQVITYLSGNTQDTGRISTGIVFHFPKRDNKQ